MKTSFIAALAVLFASQSTYVAAAKKPPPPKQAVLVQVQTDFWNMSNTPEFRQAETDQDLDTMKSLMSSIGFVPDPKFPLEVGLCLPPNYLVNVWQMIYGNNPADGGQVEWFFTWLPTCMSRNGKHPKGYLPNPVYWNPN